MTSMSMRQRRLGVVPFNFFRNINLGSSATASGPETASAADALCQATMEMQQEASSPESAHSGVVDVKGPE